MKLENLPRRRPAVITAIDWAALPAGEGKRLRALGFEEGANVVVAHRGVFGGADPLAVTLGRMTVALRRVHAAAISIRQEQAEEA
ncbi:ferrous iron transport protein A [Erythrobacter sp. LQ02-29]|uniref:FeoA family protein n=1 Tax=Erythrobacter sp. LQ02-29 TaxID=2920384 RepID=UPI001F4E1E78|nr:FeoA family protein [Erythrobacter sp. LQ02-29]MCP9221194.1 ferrous iron transport protein A [Erythrobacter sp. LQ02-29]